MPHTQFAMHPRNTNREEEIEEKKLNENVPLSTALKGVKLQVTEDLNANVMSIIKLNQKIKAAANADKNQNNKEEKIIKRKEYGIQEEHEDDESNYNILGLTEEERLHFELMGKDENSDSEIQ